VYDHWASHRTADSQFKRGSEVNNIAVTVAEACQSKPLSMQWQHVLHAGCLLHTSASFRQMQACVEGELQVWTHVLVLAMTSFDDLIRKKVSGVGECTADVMLNHCSCSAATSAKSSCLIASYSPTPTETARFNDLT
jgi:hypothetical protein